MIKNKWMFYGSLVVLILVMMLNFPFPHKYPFGETFLLNFNIPVRFAMGFNTIGITALLLLILGIYLLVKSLAKNQGRVAVIVIIILIFAPEATINAFQKTVATGIYTISYSSEESHCRFERINEQTLHGECDLFFKNKSDNDIQFQFEFEDDMQMENEPRMVLLMNNDAPYNIKLKGKESRQVNIETNIDVSDMEDAIDGGEATGVDIIISSDGKRRHL